MSKAPEAAEKQRMAHTLHLAGLTWAEVAAHDHHGHPLYATAGAAHQAAKTFRESQDFGDDLMEQRATDMARFDALQRAMWRKAIGGDLAAAKFVLALMQAREKLLGLHDLTPREGSGDPLDELAKRREAG
jgi:hypothetical protein